MLVDEQGLSAKSSLRIPYILVVTVNDHNIMDNDELPPEVVLSIQRVLNLESNSHDDPLDDLSSDFIPIDILNGFFPDGIYVSKPERTHAKLSFQKRHLAI